MKDLIIVCAGGFGREVYYMAKEIGKWNIKGFIDDNLHALDGVNIALPIIGTIKDWVPSENEVFALGVSAPKTKEVIVNIMKAKGAMFETLISPRSHIIETATMGEGCIVSGTLGDCVKLGNFVNIMGSMIGQDSIIDDYSTTTGYTNIAAAHLGKRVFAGSHSAVLNGLTVGDDAYICAGSIVFTKVKAGTKVFGNPAKRMDF
ncbi:MAG: sugar O-acyltransferase [Bacteroidales bacterium]|nr:sugar O-acyltransferase [Bacteroidales bacterium]